MDSVGDGDRGAHFLVQGIIGYFEEEGAGPVVVAGHGRRLAL
jgi:hypothetical protein